MVWAIVLFMNKLSLPEQIFTSRLRLAKHTLDEAEVMFEGVQKDRERLREFLPWVDLTLTEEDERNYLKFALDSWEAKTLFDYSMVRVEDDTYLGNIGVHSIAWSNERCELGYWILRDFEGLGYVSEAVQALEKTCFALGFHRLEIRCADTNERSARVPLRLGYTFEGTLREDSVVNGIRRSTKVFSKLHHDVFL